MSCLAPSKVCMDVLLLREIKAKNKQEKVFFFLLELLEGTVEQCGGGKL